MARGPTRHCRARRDLLYWNITDVRACTMHVTNLRKVGGSVMLAVPPALLDVLHLNAGAKVGLTVDDGKLVVDPAARPRYTMAELLAARSEARRVGKECVSTCRTGGG